MEIRIKKTALVCPAQETPKRTLLASDLDLLVPAKYVFHVYFYRRPKDSSNFFEAGLLKKALSNVLVPFYPLAGRLGRDENGRIQILCNQKGVLFAEAEASCFIDDFGDFSHSLKLLPLVPTVDGNNDISCHPLLITQVTHFKCGGVCLGAGVHHVLADGTSMFHFLNAWAEIARGLPISVPPFLDRTILGVGLPTSPTFHHIEYDPPPCMTIPTQSYESQSNTESISTSILKLSFDQINILKEKSKKGNGSNVKYSRFEILAAHIWRCVCKARGLPDEQVSKLYIPTNGRSRLNPPLPPEYFGNVVFTATPIALSGNINSELLNDTAERIHKALDRMDNDYLKSALAYLKQRPDPTILRRGPHTFKCPNLNMVNLIQMRMYDANFGWGRPIFVRPVITDYQGASYIVPGPSNAGSLLVVINLEAERMQLFEKLFYEVFQRRHSMRSKY